VSGRLVVDLDAEDDERTAELRHLVAPLEELDVDLPRDLVARRGLLQAEHDAARQHGPLVTTQHAAFPAVSARALPARRRRLPSARFS
jgi:hypothetical protein